MPCADGGFGPVIGMERAHSEVQAEREGAPRREPRECGNARGRAYLPPLRMYSTSERASSAVRCMFGIWVLLFSANSFFDTGSFWVMMSGCWICAIIQSTLRWSGTGA